MVNELNKLKVGDAIEITLTSLPDIKIIPFSKTILSIKDNRINLSENCYILAFNQIKYDTNITETYLEFYEDKCIPRTIKSISIISKEEVYHE